MKLTLDEVKATAVLARLRLSPEECVEMQRQLDAILAAMQTLQTVEVEGVAPMTSALDLACPLRPDELGPALAQDAALAAAPAQRDGFFEVPRIVAHDKEAPR